MDQNKMKIRREKLHKELEKILGNKNVYYQPPENLRIEYPCIIYRMDVVDILHADDKVYNSITRYMVTIISRDPDNDIHERITKSMRYVTYNRRYVVDGLNHDILYLYY